MVRKTYAAKGLLEFKMALNIGGAVIRILFSGGYMGSNGVVSAKYTTDNPAIIRLIESSTQFRSRRVTIYREEFIKDDVTDDIITVKPDTEPEEDGVVNLDTPE